MIPLYTKYRPRTLSEIVAQEVVVRILKNSFKNWHHLYILEGNLGSGKTSLARIMAASENCEKGPTLEPCGTCKNCTEIFSGKSLDVKEIDAATNNGIDDMRAIKEELRYAPVSCRVKYYILDEAHSLSSKAAEALLKTTEEPPSNVRLVFCTTEGQAITDTLHSRATTLVVTKIAWQALAGHLKSVCDKEGVKYEEDALTLAARTAKGSARNAIQNLQMLIDYAGGKPLTLDDARTALHAIDSTQYHRFVQAIIGTDIPTAMVIIDELLMKGGNAEVIVKGLTDHIRCLLLTSTCGASMTKLGFTEEEVKKYSHQAQQVKPTLLLTLAKLLKEARQGINLSVDPQFALEVFAIDSVRELVRASKK